jgi:choline dehydrogenase-like flavoprotein
MISRSAFHPKVQFDAHYEQGGLAAKGQIWGALDYAMLARMQRNRPPSKGFRGVTFGEVAGGVGVEESEANPLYFHRTTAFARLRSESGAEQAGTDFRMHLHGCRRNRVTHCTTRRSKPITTKDTKEH